MSVRTALPSALTLAALTLAALLGLAAAPCPAQANPPQTTLERVKASGDVRCGVFPDDPGRSAISTKGEWEGFYVDFCRAVAAAVVKNPKFVQFIEVGSQTRFTALVEKKTDVVMYSSTWTMGRESTYQVEFPTIYLFDGQGFIVRKQSGIKSVADLKGKTICVTENTTTAKTLESLNATRKLNATILYSNGDSFFRGSCDAYSADKMNLATNRANRADDPASYVILPETVSREPIGPTVRNDDPQWSRIVRAVVHAVILAEEKGLTRDTVDAAKAGPSGDGEIDALLGNAGNIGESLGLDKDWAYRVIKSVGNYAEIYDRNFGPNTPIGVERGLNNLWSRGGVLFAPPFK